LFDSHRGVRLTDSLFLLEGLTSLTSPDYPRLSRYINVYAEPMLADEASRIFEGPGFYVPGGKSPSCPAWFVHSSHLSLRSPSYLFFLLVGWVTLARFVSRLGSYAQTVLLQIGIPMFGPCLSSRTLTCVHMPVSCQGKSLPITECYLLFVENTPFCLNQTVPLR